MFVFLDADIDLAKLKAVLEGRVEKQAQAITQVDGKLANKNFVERADPEIVAAERTRRAELVLELEMLRRNLEGF